MDTREISRFIGISGDNPHRNERYAIQQNIVAAQKEVERCRQELEKFRHDQSSSELRYGPQRDEELAAVEENFQWFDDLDADVKDALQQKKDAAINRIYTKYAKIIEEEYGPVQEHIRSAEEQVQEAERHVVSLQKQLEEARFLEARNASIAQKAIDLTFLARKHDAEYQVDWINYAPIGLISWAHKGISRGVSPKTIFSYAAGKYHFPDKTVTREDVETIATVKHLDSAQYIDTRSTQNNFDLTIAECIRISEACDEDRYKELLDIGYTPDQILEDPWIASEQIELLETDRFPSSESKKQKESWCVRNAVSFPDDWNRKRVGKILYARLSARLDRSIHDASFWLTDFNPPEKTVNNEVLQDTQLEKDFLQVLTRVPEEIRAIDPSDTKAIKKALKKYQKYSRYLTTTTHRAIMDAILDIYAKGSSAPELISAEEMRAHTVDSPEQLARKYGQSDGEEFASSVLGEFYRLSTSSTSMPEPKPLPLYVGELKSISERRTQYINDAQRWLETHGSASRELLSFAWKNRELAISDGCDDNPRAIKQWADLHGFRLAYDSMEKQGQLPRNFSKRDLLQYKPLFTELVRYYDGRTAITTVAKLKEKFNPESAIPPSKIDLGNGWVGEILKKNDPRGMTIGNDTGCCMTLGGASESCIYAGYSKPEYGFFLLTRNDAVVAQSFMYMNDDEKPGVLVCDNIEANQGRDMSAVVGKYTEFFRRYAAEHTRRGTANFHTVHVGTGYTDVGITHLPKVASVGMKNRSIYTDAEKQRKLLQLDSIELAKLQSFSSEVIEPGNWDSIRESILAIENKAFNGKGYTEGHLQSEFENPNNIVVLLRENGRVIGYTSAIRQDDETLYISSTAIDPKYQGNGLVADLMYTLDLEATKRGFTHYERDARYDTGYADKLAKNYAVEKRSTPFDTPYGKQQHLRMHIPDHRLPTSLADTEIVEPPVRPFAIEKLSGDAQLTVAANLEAQIYPEALRNGLDSFQDQLEGVSEANNFSMLIREGNDVIGYVIAAVEQSEYDGETVLNIADIALLPEKQGKGYGKAIFERMTQIAKGREGIPIECEARATTSYAALMYMQQYIEETLGYRITRNESLGKYWEEYGSDEEAFLVRMESTAVPVSTKNVA